MLNSIEGNFDNPEVNELLTKHFIELRAASPEGSAHVLDIPGRKSCKASMSVFFSIETYLVVLIFKLLTKSFSANRC